MDSLFLLQMRAVEPTTVNTSDRMCCDSIELRHAFDFRERDFIAFIKQVTLVRHTRHQSLLILTTQQFLY